MPRDQWVEIQHKLIRDSEWIMDGDLGPHDVIEVRLRAADTIIFLDFSLIRCAWRAVRRSRERVDFWLWLSRYRRQSRPLLMEAISSHATAATVHLLSDPEAVRRFVTDLLRNYQARQPLSAN